MGVCTSRVSVCSIAIRPNRKHLNCKAIYSLWHRVTSSWVGLQRACVQPSSAGEETFTLTPSTWIENLWKLRKWFGWRCFFHLFSHLGTWEVCERVRVQRGEVWSCVCVCVCMCVHALKHVIIHREPTHPLTPLTWHHTSFSPHITSAGNLPDSRVLYEHVYVQEHEPWVTDCHPGESPVSGPLAEPSDKLCFSIISGAWINSLNMMEN